MEQCTSCKNKTSPLRCPHKVVKGWHLCGTHLKSKCKRNWYDFHKISLKIIPFQALWRGFSIRLRLHRAGPGVLRRSLCHNVEEMVSLEPIASIHPLEYFSFEENGKVYAFETKQLCTLFLQNLVPLNPYTRTPLTTETRGRLRRIARPFIEYKDHLIQVAQILHENGFEDFRPEFIDALQFEQAMMIRFLIAYEMPRVRTILKNQGFRFKSVLYYALMRVPSAYQYELCFTIMTALYRIW